MREFRAEFDFFRHQPACIYLDNAATMHKPAAVITAQNNFYQQYNANVHRGAHRISQHATLHFEQARDTIAEAFHAQRREEIIWCSGATAGLNQLAFGLMGTVLHPGDRILLTALEHHANIVPWQFFAEQYGIHIDVIPLMKGNRLDLTAYQQLLQRKPKVVSIAHVSNVLGHVQPIAQMLADAKACGAITVVDAAQGISYQWPDLQQLACDFLVCSGHKLFGPTGIGVLYGRYDLLNQLRPLLYGGEMIQRVSFRGTELNQLPYRLEAGTPNIAGAIGFAAAIRWLQQWDWPAMQKHKQALLQQLWHGLAAISSIELLSEATENAGIVAFNIQHEHPADVAALLDQQNVATRAGTHCAMPLFEALACKGAVRMSLAAYNTADEIEQALAAVGQAIEILQ